MFRRAQRSHKLALNEGWVTYITLANFISMLFNLGWYIPFSEANMYMSALRCMVPYRRIQWGSGIGE